MLNAISFLRVKFLSCFAFFRRISAAFTIVPFLSIVNISTSKPINDFFSGRLFPVMMEETGKVYIIFSIHQYTMIQGYTFLYGTMEVLGKKWVVPLLLLLFFYEEINFSSIKKSLKITS